MNREDIIRMAREAGISQDHAQGMTLFLEHFATLVASAERESLRESFRVVTAAEASAAILHEREACAEVCKKHADVYAKLEGNPTAKSAWAACIDNRDAIRARGQA